MWPARPRSQMLELLKPACRSLAQNHREKSTFWELESPGEMLGPLQGGSWEGLWTPIAHPLCMPSQLSKSKQINQR